MRQKEPVPDIAEELYLRRQGRAIGRCGDETAATSTSASAAPAAAAAAPAASALSEEDLALVSPINKSSKPSLFQSTGKGAASEWTDIGSFDPFVNTGVASVPEFRNS